jgi:hypothetical protein
MASDIETRSTEPESVLQSPAARRRIGWRRFALVVLVILVAIPSLNWLEARLQERSQRAEAAQTLRTSAVATLWAPAPSHSDEIAVGADGTVYTLTPNAGLLTITLPDKTVRKITLLVPATSRNRFTSLFGLTVAPDGTVFLIRTNETAHDDIVRITQSGHVDMAWVTSPYPLKHLAVGAGGYIFASCSGQYVNTNPLQAPLSDLPWISRIDASGVAEWHWTKTIGQISDMATDALGNIYVTYSDAASASKVLPSGTLISPWRWLDGTPKNVDAQSLFDPVDMVNGDTGGNVWTAFGYSTTINGVGHGLAGTGIGWQVVDSEGHNLWLNGVGVSHHGAFYATGGNGGIYKIVLPARN